MGRIIFQQYRSEGCRRIYLKKDAITRDDREQFLRLMQKLTYFVRKEDIANTCGVSNAEVSHWLSGLRLVTRTQYARIVGLYEIVKHTHKRRPVCRKSNYTPSQFIRKNVVINVRGRDVLGEGHSEEHGIQLGADHPATAV